MIRTSGLGGCVALLRPLARPLGLDLAVLRRSRRDERVDQPPRRVGDLVDRRLEGRLVRLRRLRDAADLADVLERGAADLVLGRRGLEVVERMDVSAHAPY